VVWAPCGGHAPFDGIFGGVLSLRIRLRRPLNRLPRICDVVAENGECFLAVLGLLVNAAVMAQHRCFFARGEPSGSLRPQQVALGVATTRERSGPKVDQAVVAFLKSEALWPADFTIRETGW
jgi:hypothetical protein